MRRPSLSRHICPSNGEAPELDGPASGVSEKISPGIVIDRELELGLELARGAVGLLEKGVDGRDWRDEVDGRLAEAAGTAGL